MGASAPSIEIACTKQDCFWKGAPADAPTHTCPTPAAAAEGATELSHPFAGLIGNDGKPIADETADRSLAFWVVWDDGAGETRILGTKATEADAVELAQSMTTEGIKLGEVTVRPNPAGASADVEGVKAEGEPETREELEAWLLENGEYDDAGVPQDETTARYDARLSTILDADPEPELDDDEEPELEPAAEQVGEATDEPREAIEIPPGGTATLEGPDPWEAQIARALEDQTAVKDYRWLLISRDVDAGTAELIGRARLKNEAEELLVATESAGQLPGLEIVKTKDVLEAAAEIEKRRELVVEPDVTVETEAQPQEPQEPAEEPEATPEPQEPQTPPSEALAAVPDPPATDAGGLFNKDAYKAPELAISPIDGKTIDRIAIDFSGGIMLDRSKAADVALHNRISTAQRVELWVEGTWAGTAAKPATNKEGELDVIVSRKGIRVTGLRIIDPEDLAKMELEMAFATVVRRAIAGGKTYADLFDELEQIQQADGSDA